MKCEYRRGRWAKPEAFTEPMTSVDGKFISLFKPAIDNNGNAMIVWLQHDGRNWQIFKNEYRKGRWSQAQGLSDSISPKSQDALNLDVRMDDKGNAIIVWEQSNGSHKQIFMSEYRTKRVSRLGSGSTWTATRLSTWTTSSGALPRLRGSRMPTYRRTVTRPTATPASLSGRSARPAPAI